MRIFHYISILLFTMVIGALIYMYSPCYQIIKGQIFGTYYNIKIKTDKKDSQLKNEISQRLAEINSLMSVFEKDSEISLINLAPAQQKIELSSDMSKVIKASDLVYRQTEGYFDPSLGKLIDLWGFGSSKPSEPSTTEVKQALKNSGFNKLRFSKDFRYLIKNNSQIMLNLSAIAKGWAVDEIALLLDKKGYSDYMVEIGGEIKTKGFREENGEPWTIGINRPSAHSSDNIMVISLSNMAVATSGNYRNFYSRDGRILGHTISHLTGEPVESDVASVSVFHDSCMMADAYATAIVAMGIERGLKFANRHNLKVMIFDQDLKRYLSNEAAQIL